MEKWFSHILYYADARPEAIAMIMEDRVVTYGMLKVAVERCARQIAELRPERRDIVAISVSNPIRHITLSLALFRIGLRCLSLEHRQAGLQHLNFAILLEDGAGKTATPPGSRTVHVSDEWFSSDPPSGTVLPTAFSDPGEICRLSLTSGTTGAPKIVEHSVYEFGGRILRFFDMNWNRVLCLLGISSNWAFVTCCAALATGRAVCFAESPFQAARMIELFAIDFVMASTEQLLALTRVARTSRARLQSLHKIWFGGSVPSRALLEAAMIFLCKDILCRYGASETGVIAEIDARELIARPGLIGRILPGIEIASFDDTGAKCAQGKVGTIKVRANSCDGAMTSAQDRWIDLGDAGWVSAENELYVLGRIADRGLSQADFSPVFEIEHLVRLEWDLEDAAAVMSETPAGADRPELWIGVVGNKEATAEKLAAMLHQRGLSYDIRLFEVSTIPRGVNGKVNRSQLLALLREVAIETRHVLPPAPES